MKSYPKESVANSITSALYDLLKTKSIQQITIKEITEKAKVGRVTFYRHFDSKEDVIRQHLHRLTDEWLGETNLDYTKADPTEYFAQLFRHLSSHKELGALLDDTGLIYCLKDEFDRGFLHPAGRRDQQYMDYMMAGACFNLCYYWMKNGCQETPEQMAEIVTTSLRSLLGQKI